MTDQSFTVTTEQLARQTEVTGATIRNYAAQGLLECIRLPNGMHLFRADQAERVRGIYRARVALRGRPRAPETTA